MAYYDIKHEMYFFINVPLDMISYEGCIPAMKMMFGLGYILQKHCGAKWAQIAKLKAYLGISL